MFFSRLAISIALTAASKPLLPILVPARSIACSRVSAVMTPLETGVPVSFGVLTTNTLEQAIDRAGAKSGNKGFDAAMTAVETAQLLRQLRDSK